MTELLGFEFLISFFEIELSYERTITRTVPLNSISYTLLVSGITKIYHNLFITVQFMYIWYVNGLKSEHY